VPQLAAEDAIRFGRVHEMVGEGARFARKPLSEKLHLRLPPPTLSDNLCDQERLYREIRRQRDYPIMQTGLSVLRRLPSLMRSNHGGVTALLGRRGDTMEVVDIEPGDSAASNYGVAVDVGTTTVVAHLVNLATGETKATKAKYNSQIRFGADVIARVMAASAPESLQRLHEAVIGDVNDLIGGLVQETGIRLHDVTFVMCAGNTVMTHFLYGLDPSNIRREPYVPAASMPPVIRAAEVGISISPRGLLGAIPSVACYVGGDVVADVLVTGMTESEDVSMLIDMGTNGELVLGNSQWLLCCSASAGPAFEGGGISCGMRAMHGAIERLALGPGGAVEFCGVVGNGKPTGICGSGLIDAVAELLRVGCIDRSGRFVADECGPRLRENADGEQEFLVIPAGRTESGQDIVLTESDIRNMIHTKGSIFMAAECLLEHVGMQVRDIRHVYVAGGFGNYLNVHKGIRIGLLPDLPHWRFHFIGNGSVHGARMTLLSADALQYSESRLARAMTYIDLSSSHKYMNEYSRCLFLPHTDLEKFPSLAGAGAVAQAREVGR
jgi:uncharacterized 2Fe-2S/4Fe-4S cluster protein (DUF4445 family)